MPEPTAPHLSRRSLTTTGVVAVAGLAGCNSQSSPARSADNAPTCSVVSTPTGAIPRTGMHLVTLGTKGGPSVRSDRVQPCNLLVVDGTPYVIDTGQGVTRQLILAGIDLADLKAVFITHHHSDHNLEFGDLLNAAWNADLITKVSVVAPAPIESMVRSYLDLNEVDIRTRIDDQGKVPFAPLIAPQPFSGPGVVYEDDQVKVTATPNTHPPLKDSYAFRFDTAHGSVVFSGDTAPDPRVTALAKDADWLVHEVLHLPTLDDLVKKYPSESSLRRHLVDSHTTNTQVGSIATRAGVGTLVLSHLVYFGEVSQEQWGKDCSTGWTGELIVAKDLQLIF